MQMPEMAMATDGAMQMPEMATDGAMAMPDMVMPTGGAMQMPDMTMPANFANNSQTTATTPTNVDIKFNPTINISGDMSQKSKEDFMGLLKNYASDIARMVKEEQRKTERSSYGVPAIG